MNPHKGQGHYPLCFTQGFPDPIHVFASREIRGNFVSIREIFTQDMQKIIVRESPSSFGTLERRGKKSVGAMPVRPKLKIVF